MQCGRQPVALVSYPTYLQYSRVHYLHRLQCFCRNGFFRPLYPSPPQPTPSVPRVLHLVRRAFQWRNACVSAKGSGWQVQRLRSASSKRRRTHKCPRKTHSSLFSTLWISWTLSWGRAAACWWSPGLLLLPAKKDATFSGAKSKRANIGERSTWEDIKNEIWDLKKTFILFLPLYFPVLPNKDFEQPEEIQKSRHTPTPSLRSTAIGNPP